MKYGKLIEGALEVAEYLIIGNEQVFNAAESDYLAQEYLPIHYTQKPTDGEYEAVYVERDGKIVQSWIYLGKFVVVDEKLSEEGAAADALVTGNRLNAIEYQPVTTVAAFSRSGLPKGEKTVTVQGDGTFGDTAYVVSGEDLIPRKTFNRTFPYNGVTVTKNENTYHIEGTSSANGSVVFAASSSNAYIEIDKDISGKSFKLISFSNQYTDGNLSGCVQFFDSDKTVVQILRSNGSLSNVASTYMGNATGNREIDFSIPENVKIKYAQFYITFKSDYAFNHDFQFYMVEAENTQSVTLDEPTATIANAEVTNVFTFPYQSTTETKAPIAEFIKWMTKNAKGDTATYLTPEAFGAVGDGYADDINAITLCLAMAAVTKQTVIMAKKYLVSAPVDINGNGFNVYINDIVYSGTDTAVKIHGQQNTVKIHSVTSSGIGVKFLGDGTRHSLYNDLEINTITASSHGVIFESVTVALYQNTVRFNLIKAGGDGCYGIAYFVGDGTFITENNFYGGHISDCDWAVHSVAGGSKLVNIQVEGNVKGGFYLTDYVNIINPRWAEAQRDGEYPFFKFACATSRSNYIKISSTVSLNINEIDLTENSDNFASASGTEFPIHETLLNVLDFPLHSPSLGVGLNAESAIFYTHRTYVWGKFLIMTPYMAYRKEITTATLDTRLLGQETTETEIRALSQLPTKFVVDTVNTEIYLHESYCAFGFNEFEVEQANGFTCKVYDKLNNLIFDGTEQGDGLYKFNVYKDSDRAVQYGTGSLRRDFLGHYWQVLKLGATVV